MTEVGVVDGSEIDDMGGSEMCIVGGTGWGCGASGVCVAGRWLRAFFERFVLGRGGGFAMSGGGSLVNFGGFRRDFLGGSSLLIFSSSSVERKSQLL